VVKDVEGKALYLLQVVPAKLGEEKPVSTRGDKKKTRYKKKGRKRHREKVGDLPFGGGGGGGEM